MKSGERLCLEQILKSLKASEEFRFEARKRKEIYEWVTRTLVEHEYGGQPREAKGVLRQYLGKMTGHLAQVLPQHSLGFARLPAVFVLHQGPRHPLVNLLPFACFKSEFFTGFQRL